MVSGKSLLRQYEDFRGQLDGVLPPANVLGNFFACSTAPVSRRITLGTCLLHQRLGDNHGPELILFRLVSVKIIASVEVMDRCCGLNTDRQTCRCDDYRCFSMKKVDCHEVIFGSILVQLVHSQACGNPDLAKTFKVGCGGRVSVGQKASEALHKLNMRGVPAT